MFVKIEQLDEDTYDSRHWGVSVYTTEKDARASGRWSGPLPHFSAILCETHCCGSYEFYNFSFPTTTPIEAKEIAESLSKALVKFAQDYCFCFLHLTLHAASAGKPYQPEYFVNMLTSWKGATHSRWRMNPNSNNYIQFWVLPV